MEAWPSAGCKLDMPKAKNRYAKIDLAAFTKADSFKSLSDYNRLLKGMQVKKHPFSGVEAVVKVWCRKGCVIGQRSPRHSWIRHSQISKARGFHIGDTGGKGRSSSEFSWPG